MESILLLLFTIEGPYKGKKEGERFIYDITVPEISKQSGFFS